MPRAPLRRTGRGRIPTASRVLAGVLAVALAVPPAAFAATAPTAGNALPALGDTADAELSIGTERKLGDQIMREIRRDPDYLDDPLLLEYVQTVFRALHDAARQRGEIGADLEQRLAWEVFLVRDRSFNAFALPGGYIGIHLGLLAATTTRDELASVLAHEMTHVTQRHIARSIANEKRQTLVGTAAMILGMIAASRSRNADIAQAAVAGGQALAIQGQLNFSRDMEREADRIGFGVMSDAGFAPSGMASMFEKLEQSSRLNDSGGYPYLRSHPLTSERIGEARSRLGTATHPAPVSALEHAAAQARARVLMDTRVDALRRWQALDAATLTTPNERLAAACSSALASTLLREWPRADAALAQAKSQLAALPQRDPRAERWLAQLSAQSLLERGDAAGAARAMQPWRDDGTRASLLLGARIDLAQPAGPAQRRVADDLQTWLAGHGSDAEAWALASQAWEHVGQPLRAVRAAAESRYALGDLSGAIERLRAGQRTARTGNPADFIELSVIDARLRAIERERRDQLADEKKQGG